MSCRISRELYEHMIEQDIRDLAGSGPVSTDTVNHVKTILRDSVVMHYEFLPAVMRILSNACRDGDVEIVERIIKANMEDRA